MVWTASCFGSMPVYSHCPLQSFGCIVFRSNGVALLRCHTIEGLLEMNAGDLVLLLDLLVVTSLY